jgi:hypothetical protein
MTQSMYGDHGLLTLQAQLKLAMIKCLDPASREEGIELLVKVEKHFHKVADQLQNSEDHDLLFVLLFEYQMTVHEFHYHAQVDIFDDSMKSLEEEIKRAKHNKLQKEA